MNDLDDFMGAFSKKRSQYSSEEIDKAVKRAKKNGISFMEALQKGSNSSQSVKPSEAVKPARPSKPASDRPASGKPSSLKPTTTKPANSSPSYTYQDIEELCNQASQELTNLCDHTSQEIASLNQHLKDDFGITIEETVSQPLTEKDAVKNDTPIDAKSFQGVTDEVSKTVFGQEEFLKKLLVAFKRPFILPPEGSHARNVFYISGPENSGRHLALQTMTEELYRRHILSSNEIGKMDLSIYTSAGRDHVFLQDLYTVLQSKSQVILFENFNQCHISYLSYLNDLVTKGICYLQDRYIMQKGQLVNVTNSFASEAVSTFTASGKYLVFMSTQGLDSLANVLGAPFVNALGDVCTSAALNEESWMSIARVNLQELMEKSKKQLSFQLEVNEEEFLPLAMAATEKKAGTSGLNLFFDQLLKSLATMKLEGDYPNDCAISLIIENEKLMAQTADEKVELMANLPKAYGGALNAVKAEMNEIVGLDSVKKYIYSLEEYYNTQKRRKEAGLKASEVSKHMIFAGNPGTGKTTIARIISRYLKAIGVLSGGQLVEVSRADLVGRYVGHTAPLVNNVINSALGGVLFIDEAYSLYRGKEDSFGLEAIDTLVKGIEDHRNDLIVILAGYSNEMETFLEANSGLKSRFPNIIEFPDYTGEELLSITKITVRSKGYVLAEEAETALLDYYTHVQATSADTAGNGRLVRNKVEEAILNQSHRLPAEPEADLSLLILDDFNLTDYE